jgi:Uncharacterized conserved protein (DUF2278)
VYFATAAFLHPLTEQLPALAPGFHALPRRPGGGGIDYLRSNPFDLEKVITLPYDLPGMHNDLNALLASQLERARRFEDVVRGGGAMPPPDEHEFNDGIVRIVGALVNPFGHDPGMESVTLNLSPEPIDLAGWQIANRNDDRLAGVIVGAGETVRITLAADVAPLGNQGSEISLLDRQVAGSRASPHGRAGEPPRLDPQLLKPRVLLERSRSVPRRSSAPGRDMAPPHRMSAKLRHPDAIACVGTPSVGSNR